MVSAAAAALSSVMSLDDQKRGIVSGVHVENRLLIIILSSASGIRRYVVTT